MWARLAFFLVVGSLVALISCKSSKYRLHGNSRVRVHVLYDSADLRGLAERAAQLERTGQSTNDFVVYRKGQAFLKVKEEMDRQPGYEVPGGTFSNCRTSSIPRQSSPMGR